MSLFKININSNPYAFFERFPEMSSKSIEEIASAAIPVLNLFPTIAPITNFTVAASHISSQFFSKKSKQDKIVRIAATASNMVLPILFPKIGVIPGHVYSSYISMQKCYECIKTEKYFEARENLILALSTLLYMGSVIFMTPEWIFLSILMQTICHLNQFQKHYQSKKYIQVTSDLIMACIRGYNAFFQGKTLFRNHYGNKIASITEFKNLLREAEKRSDKNLDKLLVEKNISSYIQNLKESKELIEQSTSSTLSENLKEGKPYEIQDTEEHCYQKFYEVDFSHILMRNCSFWRCEFIDCKYRNVRIEDSNFRLTVFTNCVLNQMQISESDFSFSKFDSCRILNLTCVSSKMRDIRFEQCNMIQNVFENVELSGSIFHSVIQNTRFSNLDAEELEIVHCLLKKNLFDGGVYNDLTMYLNKGFDNQCKGIDLSKAHILEDSIFDYFKCILPDQENPKIIFPSNIQGVGYFTILESQVLIKSGSSPIATRYLPPDVDYQELKGEMDQIFLDADHAKQPVAQTILEKCDLYPNIKKVVAYADELVLKGDGVLLPGGEDVNPRLYGIDPDSRSESYSYDRDLFEIALLDAAKRYHKPVLGICRGSQIGNVYYGGTLQDVEEHFDRETTLSVRSDLPEDLRSTIVNIFGEEFSFIALHFQASKQIGKNLYVVSEDEGIPKLIVSKDASCIFMQLHPEVSYDAWNYWLDNFERLLEEHRRYAHIIMELYEENKSSGIKAERLFKYFRQRAIDSRSTYKPQEIA